MIFSRFREGGEKNLTYIFGDEQSKQVAIVDPGPNIGNVLRCLQMLRAEAKYIFNTHSHWDHCAGNEQLKRGTGARVVMHTKSPLMKDISVEDGDRIEVGKLSVKVLHTPGHTPDSVCLLVNDKLFTGDTLFVGECGRTDLPGGSAEDMYYSLFNKILSLADETEVYPGHDYGEMLTATIGHERTTNYTLAKRTLEEFIEFMRMP